MCRVDAALKNRGGIYLAAYHILIMNELQTYVIRFFKVRSLIDRQIVVILGALCL